MKLGEAGGYCEISRSCGVCIDYARTISRRGVSFGHVDERIVHVAVFDTPAPRNVSELAAPDIVLDIASPRPPRG